MRPYPHFHMLAAAALVMVSGCAWRKQDVEPGKLISEDQSPTSDATSSAPAKKPQAPPEPPAPVADDGLRFPDMLGLPSARDLRRSPAPSPVDEADGITVRPPDDAAQQGD